MLVLGFQGKLDLVAFAGVPAETAQAICCTIKLHRRSVARSLVVFWNDIQDSKCVLLMGVYINFIKHTMFCLITCSYIYITL